MQSLGGFSDSAVESLRAGDDVRLADLMDSNFNKRRNLYGDGVVGASNIAAIELARSRGFAAKFTGSGGAILCMHRANSRQWLSDAEEEALRCELQTIHFAFIRVDIDNGSAL